jgi:hypothetical protein
VATVIDVGDAFELTFSTTAGADVTVSWIDPGGELIIDGQTVTETSPGQYKVTLQAGQAGMWTARFTASGTVTAVEDYYVRARTVTGPPPLAAVGDVAAQFGTLTAAQEGVTAFLLRAASAMIRHAYPFIDAQIITGRLDPDLVALAASNMVLRVLRNPNGLRSETVGPFSRSYDTGTAAGLLVISSTETGLLVPVAVLPDGSGVGGIGTIRTRPGMAPISRRGSSTWLGGWG